MLAKPQSWSQRLRTLLVLGRVSNLPTVWSNCLAGWLISGGGQVSRILGVLLGTTLLYVGGMYLNDYFDAGIDRQQRPARPIPSGRIAAGTVWNLGTIWLALGVLTSVLAGAASWLVGLLVLTIFAYDIVHKVTLLAPLLLGLCRLLLYLVAGSVADGGVAGLALWNGVALAVYVVGLSYIARQEATRSRVAWWPVGLLLVPVVLALVANVGPYREMAIGLSLLLVVWVLIVLGPALGDSQPNTPLLVQKLIAGIVLVDLLNVGGEPLGALVLLVACFALTLFGQRFVPGS